MLESENLIIEDDMDIEDEQEDELADEAKTTGSGPTAGFASLLASAKSLRNRAEKLLAQGVAESDAAAIHASLAEIAPGIEARDGQRLEVVLDTLSDLLFYLED